MSAGRFIMRGRVLQGRAFAGRALANAFGEGLGSRVSIQVQSRQRCALLMTGQDRIGIDMSGKNRKVLGVV